MAIGILSIGRYILLSLSIISIIFIYFKDGNYLNNLFLFFSIAIYSFFLSFLVFTSQASNNIFSKSVSLLWPVCTLLSVILKFLDKRYFLTVRLLLFVSIIASTIQLFFFI